MTEQEKAKAEPRDYIVLVRGSTGSLELTELGSVKAGGAHAAIRKAREESNVDVRSRRRFIAVPVRNWTEAEGGLDKPEPQFRLKDVPYIRPAERDQPEPVDEKDDE